MVTKKQNRIILGIIFLVLAGIFIQSDFFSITFKGANDISCSQINVNTLSCKATGSGGEGVEGSTGKIFFKIRTDFDLRTLHLERTKIVNPEVKEFFDTHTFVEPRNQAFGVYLPFDEENNWATRVPAIYSLGNEWAVDWSITNEILDKDQFVILKGILTPQDESLESKQVTLFGLCDAGEICWVSDIESMGVLVVNDFKIHWRPEGYTIDDACPVFNLDCPEEEPPIEPKPNETETPIQIGVYQLENNQCNQMSILESERTLNDFDTLTECQNNIVEEEIPQPSKTNITLWIIGIIVGIIILSVLAIKFRK